MDGSGDELLARAGFAADQHRGVGRGDAADMVEHRHQRGALADDFLEVVDRLDLFLEVEVLGLEPSLFLLQQHAVGDVQEHGARVLPAGFGLGPPLNPDGAAIVFAAEFEHDAARIRAAADGL